MFDFNDPFFKPLWLRLLLVGICAFWTVMELVMGSPGWAVLFLGLTLYAGYGLLVRFRPRDKEDDNG